MDFTGPQAVANTAGTTHFKDSVQLNGQTVAYTFDEPTGLRSTVASNCVTVRTEPCRPCCPCRRICCGKQNRMVCCCCCCDCRRNGCCCRFL